MVMNKVFCCVNETNRSSSMEGVRPIFPGGAVKVEPSTSSDSLNSADKDLESPGSTGRKSPSKSYNDMIKFVFTEHGIRVISDREYVV
jgi:hypothetical protein